MLNDCSERRCRYGTATVVRVGCGWYRPGGVAAGGGALIGKLFNSTSVRFTLVLHRWYTGVVREAGGLKSLPAFLLPC